MILNQPNWSLYQPVYQCEIDLRWGDCDAFGHINNVNYFRYLEENRVQFLQTLNLMTGEHEGPVVVNAWCQFLKEVHYPGTLLMQLYAGVPGRSSFETVCKMSRTDAMDDIVALGGAKVVWVDRLQSKSKRLPDQVIGLISKG